jgi:hypothetical protein
LASKLSIVLAAFPRRCHYVAVFQVTTDHEILRIVKELLPVGDLSLEDLARNSLFEVFDQGLTQSEEGPITCRHVAVDFAGAPPSTA